MTDLTAPVPGLRPLSLRLREETRRRGSEDLEAMRSRGLNVIPLDAAGVELWRQAAEGAYPRVRGGFTPADAFDRAMAIRDEYRGKAAAQR